MVNTVIMDKSLLRFGLRHLMEGARNKKEGRCQ